MADEFATPVSSLGVTSGRNPESKDSVQPQSYEDIMRQQQQEPEEPKQKQVRFRDPPAEEYDDRYMDHGRPTQDYMTGPPMHWQGQMPMQLPPAYPQAPLTDASHKDDEKKPWWKTWITQNKIGVIAAVVIFALLYVVYPRISTMERFMGQKLPTYLVAALAVAAGSGVTAINMAI